MLPPPWDLADAAVPEPWSREKNPDTPDGAWLTGRPIAEADNACLRPWPEIRLGA